MLRGTRAQEAPLPLRGSLLWGKGGLRSSEATAGGRQEEGEQVGTERWVCISPE